VPDRHQSVGWVFTETVNNSGFPPGLFPLVFLLGFLQAQYTYTGYDASAHLSEETRGASLAAARGVLMSVVISAVAGYVLIMALTFAIQDLGPVTEAGGMAVIALLTGAVGDGLAEVLLFIAVVAQLFCGMSAVTSASRMLFAFSRDRAVPAWRVWTHLNAQRVPANAVVLICVLAFLLAVPSLWNVTAYVAVTSIATIGLYIAYVLPIYLRYRAGDSFDPGPWSLGRRYRVLNVLAIAWVAFICVLFILPITPTGIPGRSDFDPNTVNYAPLTVGVTMLVVGGWWMVSARRWFKGPVSNLDPSWGR
jgi:amino acid transporter